MRIQYADSPFSTLDVHENSDFLMMRRHDVIEELETHFFRLSEGTY